MQARTSPPFGMEAMLPAFHRATRLAKALFGCFDASVVLIEEGRAWRSRDTGNLPSGDSASAQVVETQETLWVEDVQAHPTFRDDHSVSAGLGLRFYAGAPIILSNGTVLGAICAVDLNPRAYDPRLMARLTDLADGIADDCERAQLVQRAKDSAAHAEAANSILATVFNNVPMGIVMTDRDMRIVRASPRWAGFYRLVEEEVIGQSIYDVTTNFEDYRDMHQRVLAGAHEVIPKLEVSMRGKTWHLHTEAMPWREADGSVGGMLVTTNNITELVDAIERAEQANRAKSEFLANMSHEIRTPLNGVLGMAQVIEADELSDVQRERIKVVRESGAALLAILNDVLDLSKIQAGKLELEVADFDMGELAPVVVAAFEGVAAAKDVALTVRVDASAAGAWKGDILRLRQVASNLVSNALKFTAEGEVALTVSHDGAALVMAIRDTGIGIDPGKIAGLFEKFSQEDASTTRKFGGTGLGLSICRELVEMMNGRIEVESRKGEGSCFSVHLPLERGAAAAKPAANTAARPAAGDAAPAAALRILAAEDNATNQLVLRSLLTPLGVDLTLASNGLEAVAAFKAGQFDVVLMDVQMPEMNGVEAARVIRAWEAETGRARTPILSLTANVMLYQLDEYREAGMDGAIAKPIEVEKLYAALEGALVGAGEAKAAA